MQDNLSALDVLSEKRRFVNMEDLNDAVLVRSIRGEELARLLGISAKTVERWEKHGARLKARDRLALLALEEKSA